MEAQWDIPLFFHCLFSDENYTKMTVFIAWLINFILTNSLFWTAAYLLFVFEASQST